MLYRVLLRFRASAPEPQSVVFDLSWLASQPPLAARDFLAFPEPGVSMPEQLHAQVETVTHVLPYAEGAPGVPHVVGKIVDRMEQQLRATPPADVARRLARFPWVGPVHLVDEHGTESGPFAGHSDHGTEGSTSV